MKILITANTMTSVFPLQNKEKSTNPFGLVDFVLDKLCNKDNEDDDWNHKAKQENPGLKEEEFGFLFTNLEFFLSQDFVKDIACKEGKAESSKRREEVGNQKVHVIKEGFPKEGPFGENPIGKRRWNSKDKGQKANHLTPFSPFFVVLVGDIPDINLQHDDRRGNGRKEKKDQEEQVKEGSKRHFVKDLWKDYKKEPWSTSRRGLKG